MRVPLTISTLSLAVVASLTGCASAPAPQSCAEAGDQCVKFTVLHTNDHHGHFWHNKRGELGMAARKTLIDEIRAEVAADNSSVLLLSGGDINTGVPESDLQDAEPDFHGMNHLGYDAMAVGNHEFDNPLSVLDQQQQWAKFPMLAANIYKTVDGKLVRYFEPYRIFEVNGLKLAIVGLTTEQTATIGNPEFVADLTFTKPTDEIKNVIDEINAKHDVDAVFALTHMGHYQNGKHGSNTPGDVAVARALPAGMLDAIIGGHSQNPVCMEPGTNNYADFKPGDECVPDQQNGTYIMQAHEWGKYVGRADFEFYNGKLHLADYALIPVNLKKKDANGDYQLVAEAIQQDAETLALLEPYQKRGEGKLDEVISHTCGSLMGERNVVRSQITDLGVLIAEAQRTGSVNADFGIMNSGGIRASIDAGNISYRDVLTVQPFANMVTRTDMRGGDLQDYLAVVATQSQGSGGYAHFTGIEMTVDCAAKQVTVDRVNGKPFSSDALYSFTLPSYNAAGGNGYPKLDNAINTGFVDADALYQYFKANPHIDPADYAPNGEVKFINSASPLGCSAE